ncbi:hypothetical protein HDU93_000793 [Gonapodya sp. JEL0774]|nr:hypothetical protein HDU93_000793 [Gonapodya sp. JEL0774]
MGFPMATNLLKSLVSPQSLHVYDVSSEAVASFLSANPTALRATGISDICRVSDLIFVIVPGPKESYSVFADVLSHVRPGTILVECSTVGPKVVRDHEAKRTSMMESSREEAERLRDVAIADLPVSGGPWGAKDGALSMMLGSSNIDEIYDILIPFLKPMSKIVYKCGGIGNGQAAKVCNNMCSFNNMVSLAESIVLGERLGLDSVTLSRIISTSTGRSYGAEFRNPVPGATDSSPANNDYKPGFSIGLSHKDLGLAVEAGRQVRVIPSKRSKLE